jgi:hypothetical protein
LILISSPSFQSPPSIWSGTRASWRRTSPTGPSTSSSCPGASGISIGQSWWTSGKFWTSEWLGCFCCKFEQSRLL